MQLLDRPNPLVARLETVRPAVVVMEPAFLVSGDRAAGPAPHDDRIGFDTPCAGCGRVHRDRLVRFFEVRLTGSETSGGVATRLSTLSSPAEGRPKGPERESTEYA